MAIIIWMFNGAVSTKDIVKTLVKLGYKLDKYAVQKVHLVGRGLHEIDIIVYKDIIAKTKGGYNNQCQITPSIMR